jgi:transcriptional regulator with XRE-family HTH domain
MTYNFEKLKNERERRMMTLTEVAEEAGISVSTLRDIERGVGATWKKAIRKVARVLEVDVLMDGNGSTPSGRKRSA